MLPSDALPVPTDFAGSLLIRPARFRRGGPPQFPCPPSAHPDPHTPEGPSALHLQALHAFHGLRRDLPDSAPSGPLAGLASRGGRIHVMLRAERLLPQLQAFDTPLQRKAFPPRTGSLLPGALALTRTGLAPAGEHELARVRLFPRPHLLSGVSFSGHASILLVESDQQSPAWTALPNRAS